MESVVKRKLSLATFLWSYVTIFCHMWTIMCTECDTQSVCQGQLNIALKTLFAMITEFSSTFSPRLSSYFFYNIHHHITIDFVHLTYQRQHCSYQCNSTKIHFKNCSGTHCSAETAVIFGVVCRK